MKTRNKTLFSILFISLFVSCIKQKLPERIQVGEQLPPFQVNTLNEETISNETLTGKSGLIVFFSTTCPDCHKQIPEIESAYKETSGEKTIIAIAREEATETVSRHWQEKEYTIPVAAPGNRDIYNLFDRGHGSGVPLLIFFDKEGTVTDTADDKKFLKANEILKILY